MQLVKSESKKTFNDIMKDDLDCDLIVYEELRLNLLSKSCVGIVFNISSWSDQFDLQFDFFF